VSILCNVGASGQGTWIGIEDYCSGFGKRVCPFISGKSSMTGGLNGNLELYGRRGSRKDPKYPRRISVGEALGPMKEE